MLPIRRDHSIDELYSLHDDAMVNTHEAAMFLGLRPATLVIYRCHRPDRSPPYRRIGGRNIRYRMGDLREYARKDQPMSDGVRSAAMKAVEAKKSKKRGG